MVILVCDNWISACCVSLCVCTLLGGLCCVLGVVSFVRKIKKYSRCSKCSCTTVMRKKEIERQRGSGVGGRGEREREVWGGEGAKPTNQYKKREKDGREREKGTT